MVHGLTKNDAKSFPSRISLCAEEEEGPTYVSIDQTTKQRTYLKLSFQTQIPSSSLVYCSSVLAFRVDPCHDQTRITEK